MSEAFVMTHCTVAHTSTPTACLFSLMEHSATLRLSMLFLSYLLFNRQVLCKHWAWFVGNQCATSTVLPGA